MYKSLLPPNTTKLERSLDETNAHLTEIPVPLTSYIDPDNCPEELLPWLAWELSVDYWDENWSIEQKRDVIKASPYVHMKKGTPAAIRRAVEALGFTLKVITRRDERMAPHAFRVEVGISSQGIDEALYAQILKMVETNKNTRSYLSKLTVSTDVHGQIYLGSALMSGETTTIYPFVQESVESNSLASIAMAEHSIDTVHIYPAS